MGWPFMWRKTAEDEVAVWKERAEQQRERAVKAERIAVREVRNRRTIAELYAALCDERGVFDRRPNPHPVQPQQAPPRPAFDEARARAAADRIATLRAARVRAYTKGES